MKRIELGTHLEMEGEGEGWERAQGYVISVAWGVHVEHTCKWMERSGVEAGSWRVWSC